MFVRRTLNHLAKPIVAIRAGAKEDHRIVGLGAKQKPLQCFCSFSDTCDQDTSCERIQRSTMSDLHLYVLFFPSFALVV